MKKLLVLILLLLIVTVPAQAAFAGPLYNDGTKVEQDETVNNDIVVMSGDLTVETAATVNGDVILFNGDAHIAGTVNGDVVLFNGALTATNGAVINGDCVLLNGRLSDETEAGIRCTNVENAPGFMSGLPHLAPPMRGMPPMASDMPQQHIAQSGSNFWGGVGAAFLQSVLLGFLAFIIAALAPEQVREIARTARRKPVMSGGIGLLTAVAVPSIAALLVPISAVLVLVLCLGLLGFPIIFLLLLGLAVATLIGWVTIGHLLGQKLVKGLNMKHRSTAVTTTLGTFTMTMLIGLMEAIPFVFGNSLVSFIILCIGLGAVVLTRFGTHPFPLVVVKEGEMPSTDPDKVNAVMDTIYFDEDDIANLKENRD